MKSHAQILLGFRNVSVSKNFVPSLWYVRARILLFSYVIKVMRYSERPRRLYLLADLLESCT